MRILFGWVVVCFLHTGLFAQAQSPLSPDYAKFPKKEWEKNFDAFRFLVYENEGHTLPYRFYKPDGEKRGKKYPLVIFFHGAGERGFDNRTQFQRFEPTLFWQKNPCFIVAPECPAKTAENNNAETVWVDTPFGATSHQMKKDPTWPMQLAMQLIDKIIKENRIDKQRIYVTGLSMGGFATWEILQRESGLFAAAMPVCGGGDLNYAAKLVSIPLWVFHGGNDQTVPVNRSQDMVSAIKKVGGNPLYTEYPGVGHGAWSPTYSNPEVWEWLFSQVKK
jgi:predicted peptidase